ncbi:uncharacterized protein [Amphiura filiformis]|uniref:uncharacterized protein n=1 Tax=Amphiura filiformis TaxID=82378 RepID=UPI003B21C7D2
MRRCPVLCDTCDEYDSADPTSGCPTRPVRLVDGSASYEGRVEIQHMTDGWGTVCDNGWDINDAMVVCTQLGFRGALAALDSAEFGAGPYPISMYQVACTGAETDLVSCTHNPLPMTTGSCLHDSDIASVRCAYAQWGDWGSWSVCANAADTRTRTRVCDDNEPTDSIDCEGTAPSDSSGCDDTTDPVFTSTPSDIMMNTDPDSPTRSVSWTPCAASDDSGTVTVTESHLNPSDFPIGTTQVSCTATDGNGNTVISTFNVIITDMEDPTISNVPTSITVNTNAGLPYALVTWTEPTVTDNSGDFTLVSDYTQNYQFPVGTTTVTFTAIDGSGNTVTVATFTVTVEE